MLNRKVRASNSQLLIAANRCHPPPHPAAHKGQQARDDHAVGQRRVEGVHKDTREEEQDASAPSQGAKFQRRVLLWRGGK